MDKEKENVSNPLTSFNRLMNRLLEYEEYLCYRVGDSIDWETDYDIEDENIVREALEDYRKIKGLEG